MINRAFRRFTRNRQVEPAPSDPTTEALEAIRGALDRIAQSSDKNSTNPSYALFNSAVAVAILSGILFAWGYSFYVGFYQRMSLPSPISVQTPYTYLAASLNLGVFVLLALGVILLGWKVRLTGTLGRHTIVRGLTRSFGFLSLYGMIPLWLAIREGPNYQILFMGTLLGSVVLGASLLFLTFPDIVHTDKRYHLIITAIVILTIVLYIFISRAIGEDHAERLIAGQSKDGSTVELEMKNPSSTFHGSVYALVQIQDGNYYLVEMASPAPERPTLYIVPQSEVLSARLERMNGEIPTPVRPVDSPVATPATPVEG